MDNNKKEDKTSENNNSYDDNDNIKITTNKPKGVKLSHPFLDIKVELPRDKDSEVQEIKDWLLKQPHLPPLTDEHIHLFLHSNYYHVENTQSTIDAYFSIRTSSPELFSNKNCCRHVWNMTNMVSLTKTTPEGYNVLIYRLKECDPSKLNFVEAMRAFFVFNDIRLSEDGLSPGYIVVFDMKGVCLGHLARISISAIRKFMHYIQDGHPSRLKGVHVINAVAFIDKILSMVRPLMKSGLIKLLTIHGSDLTQLFKIVPMEIMPEDYGGLDQHTQKLHDNHRKMVESKYEQWLDEEEHYIMDVSKKPKTKKSCVIANTFRSLSID